MVLSCYFSSDLRLGKHANTSRCDRACGNFIPFFNIYYIECGWIFFFHVLLFSSSFYKSSISSMVIMPLNKISIMLKRFSIWTNSVIFAMTSRLVDTLNFMLLVCKKFPTKMWFSISMLFWQNACKIGWFPDHDANDLLTLATEVV